MKKEKLEVGQKIWIESRRYNFSDGWSRQVKEAEIVEANRSSAYAVAVEDLDKEKPYRHRIDQKTGKIVDSGILFGHYYVLWKSKDAYEKDVQYETDLHKFRYKVIEQVKECKSLDMLKEIFEKLEN